MSAWGVRRIAGLAVLACTAGLSALACAEPGPVVKPAAAMHVTPAVAPASGGDLPVTLAARKLYDDTGNIANTYYAEQGGAEALDDLHLIARGTIDSLIFEYYDPATVGTFSATANLYDNPGGLDLGATRIAGPFTMTSLPRGRKAVAIALPHVALPGSSVWVGVQFTSTTAGLVINSNPSVGSSHDLYLENGSFYWFNENPKANFGIRLIGTPSTAGVGDPSSPELISLAPPSPNPFRRATTLSFTLEQGGPVRLEVLDLSGRRVRALVNDTRAAGRHNVAWSGRDDAGRVVKSGVYFARLLSDGRAIVRRVVFTP